MLPLLQNHLIHTPDKRASTLAFTVNNISDRRGRVRAPVGIRATLQATCRYGPTEPWVWVLKPEIHRQTVDAVLPTATLPNFTFPRLHYSDKSNGSSDSIPKQHTT